METARPYPISPTLLVSPTAKHEKLLALEVPPLGGVSAERTGVYEVVLERDVSGCAPFATIGPPSGQVSVSQDGIENDLTTIFTSNSAGALSARSFHLAVLC